MAQNPKLPARPSLAEFGAANKFKSGKAAWLESIPEWEECVAGWQSGLSRTQIRLWLIEVCGYSPDEATVSRMAHLSKNSTRVQSA